MSTVLRWLRGALAMITPTGRAVLVLGQVCLAAGQALRLRELILVGWMSLALMVLALLWLVLPSKVQGRLVLRPPRAVAGEGVTIRVSAEHEGGIRLPHPLVSVRAGDEQVWARLDTVRSGRQVSDEITLDTPRRGVLAVGPLTHHLSDPLGLVRRTRSWAPATELYVRPRMTMLPSLGLGELRDLEGASTDTISMNDLAFHALREYVRGDDMRHVHWRSSARAGELLVRQYQESRRNQTTIVVDVAKSSYAPDGDDAFELGASVAASLVSLAGQEGQLVTLVAGEERHRDRPAGEVLDALCRIDRTPDPRDAGLAQDVITALTLARDASTLFVVSGSGRSVEDLTAAMWAAPVGLRTALLRVEPGAEPAGSLVNGRTVLTVGALAQLPSLIGAVQ